MFRRRVYNKRESTGGELTARGRTGLNGLSQYNKFLIIWFGEFISSIGSGLSSFGLGVYVFQMTGRATDVSIVTLCAFLPSVLLNPVSGVLADRFDRRLMMILGDSLSAIGLVVMLVLIQAGNIAIWQICACVAISSVFVSLLEPAYRATITDMLDEKQFAKAGGMVQLASSAKYLLSPVIAGFLLGVADIRLLLIIDIATLGVTVCSILLVRNTLGESGKKKSESRFVEEFMEGIKYLVSNKGVLILMILISAVTFYVGNIQTLFTPLILSFSNSEVLGVVESIGATGMLVSSLIIGVFSMGKSYLKVISLGLCAAGVTIALLGTTINTVALSIIAFLFFSTLPFINTSIEVLMRKTIPNETQGRVWGLVSLLSQVGYIIAYAFSGMLADNVFIPLLREDGALAESLGKIIGVGPARGIGLQLILSGISVVILAVIILKVKSVKKLETALQE